MDVQHQQWCALAREKKGKSLWPPSKQPEKEEPERERDSEDEEGAEKGTASASRLSSFKKQAEGKNAGCQRLSTPVCVSP